MPEQSKPEPNETPFERFRKLASRVMSVPRSEIQKRETEWKHDRKAVKQAKQVADLPRRLDLTKTDVIQRQLDTAIWLWFHEQDPVSIQALASGALKVLHDIGAPSEFITLEGVPPTERAELKALLIEAQNFFKHSRSDPDKVLQFAPIISEYFMYETITRFHSLFGRISINMVTFGLHFTISRPDITFVGVQQGPPIPFRVEDLRKLKREEFYSLLVTYFSEISSS